MDEDDDDDQDDDGDDDMRICVPCARSIFEPARLIKTQPGPSSSDPRLHHFDILTAGRKIIVVIVVVDGYHGTIMVMDEDDSELGKPIIKTQQKGILGLRD